jgi:Prion-inhibition and propagation
MAPGVPHTTIVGLVLGSTSFSIQLYQSALATYEVFTTARNLGKDASVLQAQLLIQEQLLRRWGDGLGLTKTEDEIDERLKTETGLFNAVAAALSNIKFILLDTEELKRRYGVEAMDEITDQGHLLSELAATQILDGETLLREHEKRQQDIEKTYKKLSIMKKLRWAIRDKERFESLISHLAKFNNGLYSLMPPVEAKILAKAVAAELLRTTDIGSLLTLQRAAQHSDTDIASLAQLKHRSLMMIRNPTAVPLMELPDKSAGLTISHTSPSNRRSIGTYLSSKNKPAKPEPVMIEWKLVGRDIRGEEKTLIETRTNNLAYLLHQTNKPKDIRALTCIGLTKGMADTAEHLKYGLVYGIPSSSPNPDIPTSLYDLLPSNDDDDDDEETSEEFDLGDKFRIARILAQSLYQLHVSGWLHKAICSDNVLFFSPQSGLTSSRGPQKTSNKSLFLAGYEFARPGRLRDPTQKAGTITIDLYAHPAYRSGGNVKYRRLFDIYSLGVVLLEIGLWRRVESGVTARQTAVEVRDTLVEACERQLGPAMGSLYRDAVSACLKGEFPVEGLAVEDEEEPKWEELSAEEITALEAKDEQINSDLSTAFYWKVVKVLGLLNA